MSVSSFSSTHRTSLNPGKAIMLARIKMDLPSIRNSLLEIDDLKLSTDDLKAISRQLPTAEEINRIKDFGDISKLAKADQYFGQVATIGHLVLYPCLTMNLRFTVFLG